jgi:hypothetical protein
MAPPSGDGLPPALTVTGDPVRARALEAAEGL